MKSARFLLMAAGAATVAACVPRTPEPPPPQPQPQPVRPVRPTPPPPPPPATTDWSLLPLTPGGWIYRSDGNTSQALFGPAAGQALFALRCDRAANRVTLVRSGGATGTTLTLRTSFTARNFPAQRDAAGLAASLPASDSYLDGIAFSRGRFTVEAEGLPMLVIPAWPEPARVVEDCRG
jgi:hypothetical protein